MGADLAWPLESSTVVCFSPKPRALWFSQECCAGMWPWHWDFWYFVDSFLIHRMMSISVEVSGAKPVEVERVSMVSGPFEKCYAKTKSEKPKNLWLRSSRGRLQATSCLLWAWKLDLGYPKWERSVMRRWAVQARETWGLHLPFQLLAPIIRHKQITSLFYIILFISYFGCAAQLAGSPFSN